MRRSRVLLIATVALAACCLVSCSFRKDPIRNVLLISIDTLRADHVGSYGFPAALRGGPLETRRVRENTDSPLLASSDLRLGEPA